MLWEEVCSHWLTAIDMSGFLARWFNVWKGLLAQDSLVRRVSDVRTVGMIRGKWDTMRDR